MRPPLAALGLSALLVVSGCLGVLDSAPSDPGAEAVVESAVAAGDSVETYRVESRLYAAGAADGERRVVRVTSAGLVDRADRRVRLTATTDDANRTVYVVGNTTYTECAEPWDGWGVETQDELDEDWAANTPLGRQLSLLAESPVTWVGNETVRGMRAHVVEARPAERTLRQFGENRRGLIDPFGPRIENATFTAWIAAESHRLLETHLAFDVRSNDGSVEARMNTTFSRYSHPVSISLPESARTDQFELGCPQG